MLPTFFCQPSHVYRARASIAVVGRSLCDEAQVDHPNGSSRSITLSICTAFKHDAAECVTNRGLGDVWGMCALIYLGLASALKMI